MNLQQRNAYFRSKFKTREEGAEKIIEGYFIVYDQRTELWDDCYEVICAGACTNSIAKNDVRALYNHDTNAVLGRESASTLVLNSDSYGVYGTVIINQADTEALNIYERVKRGDIDGCSFGFYPTIEERQEETDGSVTFSVKEADVLEVSVCPFPAYPTTSIQARKQEFEQHKKRQLQEKKQKIRERLNHVKSTKNQ